MQFGCVVERIVRMDYFNYCNSALAPYGTRGVTAEVKLNDVQLWDRFNHEGTEMVITKGGRRLFPSLSIDVKGLDPNEQYCILLFMAPSSEYKWKYSANSGWEVNGAAEAESIKNFYIHPDSPALGERWMSQSVTFSKVKLTNVQNPQEDQIVLNSMHFYQPKFMIVKANNLRTYLTSPYALYAFENTRFIAVTAYQNKNITQLKIDNNPFAKGFRETGKSKKKKTESINAQLMQNSDGENNSVGYESSSSDRLSPGQNLFYTPRFHPTYAAPTVAPRNIFPNQDIHNNAPRPYTDFSIKRILGIE